MKSSILFAVLLCWAVPSWAFRPYLVIPGASPSNSLEEDNHIHFDADGDGRPEIVTTHGDSVDARKLDGTLVRSFKAITSIVCPTCPSNWIIRLSDVDFAEIERSRPGRELWFNWSANGPGISGSTQGMAVFAVNGDCVRTMEGYFVSSVADFDGNGSDELVLEHGHFVGVGTVTTEIWGEGVQTTGVDPSLQSTIRSITVTPTPSIPPVALRLELRKRTAIRVRVFDSAGRNVRDLGERTLEAGSATMWWDGRDSAGNRVPTGVYFFETSGDRFKHARKAVVLE